MKIVVLIKQTPDTAELPAITVEEVQQGSIQATLVVNPWDEYAVEEALQLDERFGADAVVMSLGSPDATDALKRCLAVGIGEAKLIDRGDLAGGDMWMTAAILAAAVTAENAEESVDLVLTGMQSVDENSSAVPIGVARKLGWPVLTNVAKIVDIADGRITVERLVDGQQEVVRCALPAVVSVSKEINEPRDPNIMGIRKANRATIPVVTPADLGVGELSPHTQWTNLRKPESRDTTVRMIEGATAQETAANLVDALLADKVL